MPSGQFTYKLVVSLAVGKALLLKMSSTLEGLLTVGTHKVLWKEKYKKHKINER